MWWIARRACARCSQRLAAYRGRWILPSERADFGWTVLDATGWGDDQLADAIDAVASHAFDLAAEIPFAGKAFPV